MRGIIEKIYGHQSQTNFENDLDYCTFQSRNKKELIHTISEKDKLEYDEFKVIPKQKMFVKDNDIEVQFM